MGRNIHRFQTNFTSGQLDSKLAARDDVKFFYNGCALLKNFDVIPQGGAQRRPGTAFVAKLARQVYDVASSPSVLIPQGEGTPIGTFPVLSELFDGVTIGQLNNHVEVAAKYGGKDWGSGVTKTIRSVRAYVDQPPGYESVEVKLQGSTDNFSSSVVDLTTTILWPHSGAALVPYILIEESEIDTTTAYRYHRLEFDGTFEGGYNVQEIYFCGSSSSSPASASTTNGGTAANAVDGDPDTYLQNTTSLGTTDDYVVVTVDLGSAMSVRFVDAVNLYTNGSIVETDEFDIEYSSDNFSSDVNVFGPGFPRVDGVEGTYRLEHTTREAVSARYWRLIRNGTTDLGTGKPYLGELRFMIDTEIISETRLIPFEFNTEQTYMMAATDENIAVVQDGVVLANIPTDYESDELWTLDWTQSADTIIIVHRNHAPVEIRRDTSYVGVWDISALTLSYIPKYDFSPTITNYTASTDYLTPSAKEGSITLTLASSTGKSWGASDVGQIADTNGGLVRITSVISTTVALGVVIVPLYTTAQDTNWDLLGGYEDVWSTSRGWPQSTCFFEGRLWFGGSLSRPHTIWGSRIDDFGNFDLGQGLADDALSATLDTDQINEIVQIYPGRDLQVFTSGAEFYLPQPLGEPISPTTIQVKRETSRGTKKGLRVAEVEGGTIFIQRGGKGVREYLFNEVEQSYNADNISLLSSDQINQPVDFALRRANETNEADKMYIVNLDGTIATCSTLRSQDITAWTPWEIASAVVKNVAAMRGAPPASETETNCHGITTVTESPELMQENPVYIACERTIDGETDRYLEILHDDYLGDFSGIYEPTTSSGGIAIPGMDHLEGETVAVFNNGVYQGSTTISSGSTVATYTVADGDRWEVGYSWVVSGKTMPVSIDAQGGSIRARLKRPVEATFFVEDTDELSCNGNTQTITYGTDGQIVFQGLSDYTEDGQVTFTQPYPGRLTLLGIDVEVSF